LRTVAVEKTFLEDLWATLIQNEHRERKFGSKVPPDATDFFDSIDPRLAPTQSLRRHEPHRAITRHRTLVGERITAAASRCPAAKRIAERRPFRLPCSRTIGSVIIRSAAERMCLPRYCGHPMPQSNYAFNVYHLHQIGSVDEDAITTAKRIA
jgi:hypothetical protein